MDQIYTVTTDNGANMIKAVNILASDEDYDDIEQTEDNTIDTDCDIYLEKNKEKNDEIDEEYLNVFENIEIESDGDDINSNFQNNIFTLTGKELLN